VHALGSGTDAIVPAIRYAMLASLLPVLFLFALRIVRSHAATKAREGGHEGDKRCEQRVGARLPPHSRRATVCTIGPGVTWPSATPLRNWPWVIQR
jgi:hypothetical protein